METTHGNKFKREVCIYECAGTALLVYAVNVSKADPVAICFSLFTAIMIAGPISGGHFNPAVTIGVFISQNKPVEKLVLLGCIIASQFAGGLIGALFAFLSLTNVTETVN